MKPKITITLTERRGQCPCHHGHKPGDSFDFDQDRGRLCPMAMHVAFIYADILRYGGRIPGEPPGTARFCCPDPDTMNVFKLETRPAGSRPAGSQSQDSLKEAPEINTPEIEAPEK